jgi:multiple sugar transport system ATP-binding protein
LRPESLELAGAGGAEEGEGIHARVEVVEELGADAFAFCVAEVGDGEATLIARADCRRPPERGDRVALLPRVAEAHVFDPETGERLGV